MALTKSLASALSHDIAFAALLLQYYMQTLTLTLTPILTLTVTRQYLMSVRAHHKLRDGL